MASGLTGNTLPKTKTTGAYDTVDSKFTDDGTTPKYNAVALLTTGTGLAKANDLSDLASAPTARTNLGLGSAAQSNTSAFDAAGAAGTAQAAAIAAAKITAANTFFVSATGNDGTAERGNPAKPYLTAQTAFDAAIDWFLANGQVPYSTIQLLGSVRGNIGTVNTATRTVHSSAILWKGTGLQYPLYTSGVTINGNGTDTLTINSDYSVYFFGIANNGTDGDPGAAAANPGDTGGNGGAGTNAGNITLNGVACASVSCNGGAGGAGGAGFFDVGAPIASTGGNGGAGGDAGLLTINYVNGAGGNNLRAQPGDGGAGGMGFDVDGNPANQGNGGDGGDGQTHTMEKVSAFNDMRLGYGVGGAGTVPGANGTANAAIIKESEIAGIGESTPNYYPNLIVLDHCLVTGAAGAATGSVAKFCEFDIAPTGSWSFIYCTIGGVVSNQDTGWTANQSGGDKTVSVQDYAPVNFAALDIGNIGLNALSSQVSDLTKKFQALEAILSSGLIPNA